MRTQGARARGETRRPGGKFVEEGETARAPYEYGAARGGKCTIQQSSFILRRFHAHLHPPSRSAPLCDGHSLAYLSLDPVLTPPLRVWLSYSSDAQLLRVCGRRPRCEEGERRRMGDACVDSGSTYRGEFGMERGTVRRVRRDAWLSPSSLRETTAIDLPLLSPIVETRRCYCLLLISPLAYSPDSLFASPRSLSLRWQWTCDGDVAVESSYDALGYVGAACGGRHRVRKT
ncbi:hypothetical protein B0H14DRAFT_2859185 [Mycena olivaceomarginata]|nr:hypothetical protein B0H14DRAFT_2859185 [Mycena olivaceomarginata]